MPPEGRLLPTGVGGHESAITPIIGTMLVFVIIFGGMAGALIFGVPTIKGLQDRAAVDDMATQLGAVRREAERLTAEGAGASVALAPSQGSINLEEGTRMAVAISYDGQASQQGLALAWGKGGKKKNLANLDADKNCDFHIQDWADGDARVTLAMDPTDCQHPMLWNPSDGGGTTTAPRTQELGWDGVVASTGWSGASMGNLGTADTAYATSVQEDPNAPDHDLRGTLADPVTGTDTVTSLVLWARVSVVATSPQDGFSLGACIGSGTTTCMANNKFSSRLGASATEVDISHNITTSHPNGNQATWSWSDIAALQPIVRLDQQGGGADGTYRVNRVWVVVTSGPVVNTNDSGKCYEASANPEVACLQGYKVADNGAVNRITAIADCDVANPPAPCPATRQDNTYVLTLDDVVEGDWYFQLSNDPRSTADTLLAKVYIFDMDQLRWVRDEGLTTWLEGGAVFATRSGTHYLHSAPIFDESITGRLLGNLTYYVRIIRFQGEDASISGTGTSNVFLRHNATQSTTNDGVVGARFDFAGEGAELWCNALMRRDVPTNYYYQEHPDFPCDGAEGNDVRSVQYAATSSACNILTMTTNDFLTCRRENVVYFQMLFTEVLYDVTIRP